MCNWLFVKNTDLLLYTDGCRSVDRINCGLVTPVSRQRQSDGFSIPPQEYKISTLIFLLTFTWVNT